MTSISSELNSRKSPEGKNNFQRFILIDRNGDTVERIILSVPDIQLREEIISMHFLSRYVNWFLKEDVGANLIGRDNPWDFEWKLSNSENLIIEITSIAENDEQFRKQKYEERLAKNSYNEEIKLHELEKISFNFPDDELLNEKIAFYRSVGKKSDDYVANPYYNKKGIIFISRIDEEVDEVDNIIKQAIEKKINKKHSNKENVTLIIDNRTVTYELNDLLSAFEKLADYLDKAPFKEIWFYTGYYSDNDGNNAEYSFSPLKISDERLELLKTILQL